MERTWSCGAFEDRLGLQQEAALEGVHEEIEEHRREALGRGGGHAERQARAARGDVVWGLIPPADTCRVLLRLLCPLRHEPRGRLRDRGRGVLEAHERVRGGDGIDGDRVVVAVVLEGHDVA